MFRKLRQFSLSLIALFSFVLFAGCKSTNPFSTSNITLQTPRLIKVSFVGQRDSFRIRVNQEPIGTFGNSGYANLMVRMNLGYGDIVVWEDQRDESGKELSHPKDLSDWWFKYLKQTRASFYSIPQQKDFFSARIFHWLAPSNPPKPLSNAQFFENGKSLGTGTNGFQNMIKRVRSMQSGAILILAPRIKNEGQEAHWIQADNQLTAWSKDAGFANEFEDDISKRLVDFIDWGRFMDDN